MIHARTYGFYANQSVVKTMMVLVNTRSTLLPKDGGFGPSLLKMATKLLPILKTSPTRKKRLLIDLIVMESGTMRPQIFNWLILSLIVNQMTATACVTLSRDQKYQVR